MAKLSSLLAGAANVGILTPGIHSNVVITKVDTSNRKGKDDMPSKKMFYITFAQVDPTTRKRLKEVEVSWWRFDPTKPEYLLDSLFEVSYQLTSIMKCYATEEEISEATKDIFSDFGFETPEEIIKYKWKKQDLLTYMNLLGEAFSSIMESKVGLDSKLLYLKIVSDSKGLGIEIPKYGDIIEVMEEGKETSLKMSAFENKVKTGTIGTATTTNNSNAHI